MGSEFRGCWRAELDGKADRAGQGGGWVPENTAISPDFCLWDMAFDEGGGPEQPRHRQRRITRMCFLPPQAYCLQEWELGKCQVPREKLGRAWLPGPTHTLSLEILWVCARD